MSKQGVVAAMLGCTLVVGCSHVKPYEREYLARPGMETSREDLPESFFAHVQDAREGAPGSMESAGGGCGCN